MGPGPDGPAHSVRHRYNPTPTVGSCLRFHQQVWVHFFPWSTSTSLFFPCCAVQVFATQSTCSLCSWLSPLTEKIYVKKQTFARRALKRLNKLVAWPQNADIRTPILSRLAGIFLLPLEFLCVVFCSFFRCEWWGKLEPRKANETIFRCQPEFQQDGTKTKKKNTKGESRRMERHHAVMSFSFGRSYSPY